MIVASHGIIGSSIGQFVGLLDEYSGAAAAYSLRKLRAAYTGSAIGVRIDTAEQPEYNIGFVDGELDVATLEGYCTGGLNAFVKTWYDQSGNAINATQTTAANQPQIVSSGSVILENGKPAIRFGQGNITSLINNSFTTYQTGFTVTRFITRPSFAYILRQSGNFKLIGDINGQSYRLYRGVSLYSGTPPSLTNQNLIYAFYNGANSEIAVDGGSEIIGNAGVNSGTGLFIGTASSNLLASTLNGNIQEIVLYNSDESSNRTGIETNINDFYSIY
jgi:hypothetical protein